MFGRFEGYGDIAIFDIAFDDTVGYFPIVLSDDEFSCFFNNKVSSQ